MRPSEWIRVLWTCLIVLWYRACTYYRRGLCRNEVFHHKKDDDVHTGPVNEGVPD